MIKINLLGEEGAGSADNMMWLAVFGASVAALFVLFIGAGIYMNFSISGVQEQVVVADGQLAHLREKTKEVSDLERKKIELQNMTLAIANLKKSQEGPVKLLDDLNAAMPEKLWLGSASFTGNKMRLEGIALNDEAIVRFTQALKQSPYFEDIALIDRITSNLAQINTFNSLDGTQARIITRAEKDVLEGKLNEIRYYAENRGMLFSNNPPDTNVAPDPNSISNGGSQTVTKLSFEGSMARKMQAGRPTFFAWENLQHVQGQNFIIESKMSYTPKGLSLDLLTTKLAPPASSAPAKAVSKTAPAKPARGGKEAEL